MEVIVERPIIIEKFIDKPIESIIDKTIEIPVEK